MPRSTAITIGNFDGVHLGHVALVTRARELAGSGGAVRVLCLDPHPVTVLNPGAAPRRLSTFGQRERWLRDAGADEVIRLEPTRSLLSMAPREFLEDLLARHQPEVIVEGADFRFGRDRAGTIHTLHELARDSGFAVDVVAAVDAELIDQIIARASSSAIRELVRRGRVRDAAALLGRPYELEVEVVRGDQRGREIGIPTANLAHRDMLLPADGVYVGLAENPDGARYPAAISVGDKPTFDGRSRICEAHLLGFDGALDEYGWTIRLEVHDWIRDQLTFPTVEALLDQMQRDLEAVGEMVLAA